MIPAPIHIAGQETIGFFPSFGFELNVFERKKAEKGSPFSFRSSSRSKGIPAKWSNVRRTDEIITTQTVRRLEIDNPQHSSFACQSNLKAKSAVNKKAKTSKEYFCKFIDPTGNEGRKGLPSTSVKEAQAPINAQGFSGHPIYFKFMMRPLIVSRLFFKTFDEIWKSLFS